MAKKWTPPANAKKKDSNGESGWTPPSNAKKKVQKKEASSVDSEIPTEQQKQSGESNNPPSYSIADEREQEMRSNIDANLERVGFADSNPTTGEKSENPPITTQAQLEGRMVLQIESLNKKTKALQKKKEQLNSFGDNVEQDVQEERSKVDDYILPMPRKLNGQEFYTQKDQESVEEYKERVEEFNNFIKKYNVDGQEEYSKLVKDYNGDVEQLNTDAKTLERWYKTNKDLIEEDLESPMLSSFHSGFNKLVASIYRTPEFVYDLAANGYNLMLEGQDALMPESLQSGSRVMTSNQLSDITGIDNVPAENLEKAAAVIDEKVEKYRGPIFENIKAGNYEDAAYSTALSISESLPFMLSIMLPSAAGVSATRMFAGTTAVMGAQQKQELQGRDDLSETQKNANALAYGVAESFEVLLGGGNAGRVLRQIIKNQGKETGIIYARRVVGEVMKNSPALEPFREGLQEGMTTYTQNLADIYINGEEKDATEGIADAIIVGSAMGFGSGTVTGITKYRSKKKDKNAEAINMAALNTKVEEGIKKNIKDRFDSGLITEEEMNTELIDFQESLEADTKIPETIKGEKRTRALELQKEYDQVSKKEKKVGKAFKKPYQERLAQIENELTGLVEEGRPTNVELQKFTNPTDDAYGYINRGQGKGNEKLTKAEYEKLQSGGTDGQTSTETTSESKKAEAEKKTEETEIEPIEVTDEEISDLDNTTESETKTIEDNLEVGDEVELSIEPKGEQLSEEKKTPQDQSGAETTQDQQPNVETVTAEEQVETSQEKPTKTVKAKGVRGNFEYEVDLNENNEPVEVRGKNGRVIEPYTYRKTKNGEKKVMNGNYMKIVSNATGEVTSNQARQEDKALEKEALDQYIPTTPYEAALYAIANGAQVKREAIAKETGEAPKNGDWRVGLNKEEKLPSIERLAEQIWEDNEIEFSDSEIRDALIDIYSSYTSLDNVKADIIETYQKSIDPYHGVDVDEMVEAEKERATEEESYLYNSVEDADQSLSQSEKQEYYERQYEEQYENLTEEQKSELESLFINDRLADQNESNEESNSQKDASKEKEVKEDTSNETVLKKVKGVKLIENQKTGEKIIEGANGARVIQGVDTKGNVFYEVEGDVSSLESLGVNLDTFELDENKLASVFKSLEGETNSKDALIGKTVNIGGKDRTVESFVDMSEGNRKYKTVDKDGGELWTDERTIKESVKELSNKQSTDKPEKKSKKKESKKEQSNKEPKIFQEKIGDDIKVLKKLPADKMNIKADAINKKIDKALKEKEITEDEAAEAKKRVDSFVTDKFIKGLNNAIDDLDGMTFSSLIPPSVLKVGLITVREAYVATKNLAKALEAGINAIKKQMGQNYDPKIEKEFKDKVKAWLKSGQEKAKTEEGKRAIAFANIKSIVNLTKESIPDLKAQIKDYLKGLPKGTLSDFKSKKLAETAAKVEDEKGLDKFIAYAEKTFIEARLNDFKREVSRKVKKAKQGRGRSTIGQYAKTFSKLNLSGVEDIDLLERIGQMAEDLSSKTPTTTIQEINEVIKEVEKAKEGEVKDTKSLNERVKNHLKKREGINSTTTYINSEIERQELLSEASSSEFDSDLEYDLMKELEEDVQVPSFNNNIDSSELAAKASGDIRRAKNAITKAFKDGNINESTKERLELEIDAAVNQFNKEMEGLLKVEQAKSKENVKSIEKEKSKLFNAQQERLIDLLLKTKPVDEVSWVSRFNKVADSILSGNLPISEIASLREYAAYKSQDSIDLAEAISEVKSKGRNLKDIVKRLGTKEIGQRVRNVLKSRNAIIDKLVYSPLARALDETRKLSASMSDKYVKAARKASKKQSVMVGMIGHYMRENSLKGTDTKADNVEVGSRDIFGIMLGNEAAMEAAGMEEKTKKLFRKRQALDNYSNKERKLIEKIYNSLPKENGYVDVSKIDASLLDKKGRKMLDAMMEMHNEGVELQEISNLSRNQEFKRQAFYWSTWRNGGDRNAIKPEAQNEVFSTQAKSGKEKTTESLRPSLGSYIVDANEMAVRYSNEVAVDYVFSLHQPVQNALLNSAINQTGEAVVGRAVKLDYNASLYNEKSVGNMNTLMRNVFGARYAATLFDLGRQIGEIFAAFAGNPFRTRSIRAITDVFSKKQWRAMRGIEKEYGFEVSSFQSAQIERMGIVERSKKESWIVKVGRKTMGLQEYLTSIGLFMPEFRREFKKQTGENFDVDKFNNDPNYKKEFDQAMTAAISKGQQMVYRAYGTKSKGTSRRDVEVLPSFLNFKSDAPVTIKSDSNTGRIISFFGNFAYREQGEFFQSLKFFLKDIPKGKLSLSELSNAAGILANATTYMYATSAWYLYEKMLLGDEEEKEEAEEEMNNMLSVEGLSKSMINQVTFFSTGKYGKVSRNVAIGALSVTYYSLKDQGKNEEAKIIKDLLQDNFYVYKPVNIKSPFDMKYYGVGEFAPALSYQIDLISKTYSSGRKLTKDEASDIVFFDFLFNATNLTLGMGYGTQLPFSKQMSRQLRRKQKESK